MTTLIARVTLHTFFAFIVFSGELAAENSADAPATSEKKEVSQPEAKAENNDSGKDRHRKNRASKRKERSREHKEHRREQRRNRKQGLN
jgi:hypothetical protein